jgi:hypothetical protein
MRMTTPSIIPIVSRWLTDQGWPPSRSAWGPGNAYYWWRHEQGEDSVTLRINADVLGGLSSEDLIVSFERMNLADRLSLTACVWLVRDDTAGLVLKDCDHNPDVMIYLAPSTITYPSGLLLVAFVRERQRLLGEAWLLVHSRGEWSLVKTTEIGSDLHQVGDGMREAIGVLAADWAKGELHDVLLQHHMTREGLHGIDAPPAPDVAEADIGRIVELARQRGGPPIFTAIRDRTKCQTLRLFLDGVLNFNNSVSQ